METPPPSISVIFSTSQMYSSILSTWKLSHRLLRKSFDWCIPDGEGCVRTSTQTGIWMTAMHIWPHCLQCAPSWHAWCALRTVWQALSAIWQNKDWDAVFCKHPSSVGTISWGFYFWHRSDDGNIGGLLLGSSVCNERAKPQQPWPLA